MKAAYSLSFKLSLKCTWLLSSLESAETSQQQGFFHGPNLSI